MRVLGISCDYHDAAAALVVDGEVVAAAEEERFTRVKHDSSLPAHAVASCLATAGLRAGDLDAVVFHEKPLAVLSRVVAARQRRGPGAIGTFSREMPVLLGRNVMVAYRIETLLRRLGAPDPPRLAYGEHHMSHAAAAFYPSPFESAAVLTIDGIGEWATASMGHGTGRHLDLLAEQRYPHSLGLLYSLLTTWCGFASNDGEYKLMGLAPFGEPRFTDALAELVQIDDRGGIHVDVDLIKGWDSRVRSSTRLHELLGGPPTAPGEPPDRRDADLARSVQLLTEDAVLAMARHAHRETGARELCLAGGVALNCVANGRLLEEGPFDAIWVQPAAGDAGSAVGAALWWWHQEHGAPRSPRRGTGEGGTPLDGMRAAQLGPWFDRDEVHAWLGSEAIPHEVVADDDERCRRVAARLAEGAVVGWFEGAMEFGPRALGHRSLLADPRSPTVQRDINLRVKGRESFRPFAPAVLWERASDWFDLTSPSPYMLRTCRVVPDRLVPVDEEPEDFVARVQVVRSQIPACTHVDGSARVQTVHADANPLFHRLLRAFEELTGCPVLLNTSFNRAGEPVVCTPDDALRTAVVAGLDLLVVEDALIPVAEVDLG